MAASRTIGNVNSWKCYSREQDMDCLNDALLPGNTKKLWATICSEPTTGDFSGFILVGGTALSLRIGHRISEDLDFVWAHNHPATHYDALPRQAIDRAIYHLRNNFGFHIEKISYPAEEDDFTNDGLDLDDFHQDYIVGGTKVTFFKASPDACTALGCANDKSRDNPLRVATIHEVFLLKSLVVTERAKTRDYFDLYTLLKERKANLQDAHDLLSKSGIINGWDVFSERLSSLPVRKDDEGYRQMLDGEDHPSLDDMREFFRDRLGQYGMTKSRDVTQKHFDGVLSGNPLNSQSTSVRLKSDGGKMSESQYDILCVAMTSVDIMKVAHDRAAEHATSRLEAFTARKRGESLEEIKKSLEAVRDDTSMAESAFANIGERGRFISDDQSAKIMRKGGLSAQDIRSSLDAVAQAAESFGYPISELSDAQTNTDLRPT
jgi:hypothetical protein